MGTRKGGCLLPGRAEALPRSWAATEAEPGDRRPASSCSWDLCSLACPAELHWGGVGEGGSSQQGQGSGLRAQRESQRPNSRLATVWLPASPQAFPHLGTVTVPCRDRCGLH